MAMAVVALTLTEDLNMKNVLLNVVALEFILQADSLLLKYWCRKTITFDTVRSSSPHQDVEEQSNTILIVTERPSTEKRNDPVDVGDDYSWWAPRVETVVIGIVMIVTVQNVMTVVEAINNVLIIFFHRG